MIFRYAPHKKTVEQVHHNRFTPTDTVNDSRTPNPIPASALSTREQTPKTNPKERFVPVLLTDAATTLMIRLITLQGVSGHGFEDTEAEGYSETTKTGSLTIQRDPSLYRFNSCLHIVKVASSSGVSVSVCVCDQIKDDIFRFGSQEGKARRDRPPCHATGAVSRHQRASRAASIHHNPRGFYYHRKLKEQIASPISIDFESIYPVRSDHDLHQNVQVFTAKTHRLGWFSLKTRQRTQHSVYKG